MAMLTTGVPMGAIARLVEHYGCEVHEWLSRAEIIVRSTAMHWQVRLYGFHDAGWTSVVAVGRDKSGRAVILKALPETDRYRQELAALTHWDGVSVCRLLGADDDHQVLMVDLVGGGPGGAERPSDHVRRVANALPRLHRTEVDVRDSVPLLADYYLDTVLPRIERRASQFGDIVGATYIQRAVSLARDLCSERARSAMLHSDLYAENVLFDKAGCPAFIDPHPKIGSPAFDWAFWCVYYNPMDGSAHRAALCRDRMPALFDEVMAWSVTLAVDGALYYLQTDDPTANAMMALLESERRQL